MKNNIEQKGFNIEFEFLSNEYFTNKILTKSYEYCIQPNTEHDLLKYNGPKIIKSYGCNIKWNKNKNITMKLVKKRQKHKTCGIIRIVTKEIPRDSFFNFFSTSNSI